MTPMSREIMASSREPDQSSRGSAFFPGVPRTTELTDSDYTKVAETKVYETKKKTNKMTG